MKKPLVRPVLFGFFISFITILNAQDHFVKIDFEKIKQEVISVRSTDDYAFVSLPIPDRGFIEFKAIKNTTITDDFAKDHPEIKSFDIICPDDPTFYGALTIDDEKLYASIMSNKGIIGIWPVRRGERDLYKCYLGNSDPEHGYSPVICQQDASEHAQRMIQEWNEPIQSRSTFTSGEKLKTFKLVLICTGEFYEANGGTNTAVNALITAIVNGWNVILKKELSIRLTLTQSPFLYTDKNTDPFIPDEAGGNSRPTQAVDAIHAKFSAGSYDIGHVLHNHHPNITADWSSGGVAGLGVVCSNSTFFGTTGGPNKAAGWSGSSYNDGNDFIQLSIHEVGHQFNMTHTFNGTGESCTDNISETTAYEIGSGTTIMSYNGVCSDEQNIPPSGELDNYYHVNSLERAINFIAASTCGTLSNTNNISPIANAGNDYTIPKNTPFMLAGSATDENSDILSYCWEQYDEDGTGAPTQGLIGSNAANNSIAPLFRSYPPTDNPVRYFPGLNYILMGENKNSTFEALPAVARTMKFRFTARDNNNAGGGVAWDENMITVVSNSGPFEITSQNTPTTLTSDGTGTFTVQWNVANTDNPPVSCSNVDILFSIDGGKTFPFLLASTENDGVHTLAIPDYSTVAGRIMIKAHDNIFFDVNNADIKVQSPCAPLGANFTPTTNYKYDHNKTSKPNLDLNLIPAYGQAITKFSGSITTSDEPSNLVYLNEGTGQCTIAGNDVTYDIFKFYVSISGSYTFLNSGTAGLVLNIYQDEYNELDLCGNMIGTNAIKTTGSSTVTISNILKVDLIAGKEYYIRISSFSPTFPVQPANYSITPAIKPTGALMYDNIPSPGPNYFYTFVAYNAMTEKIHTISESSDFRGLITDFGIYYVKGISVAKSDSMDFMQYVDKTISEVEDSIFEFALCAELSSNQISIEIIEPKCDLSTVNINNIICHDNETGTDPYDDYISFSLLASYGSYTDTFSFKHLDSGFITPDSGKFGTESEYRLYDGSAGNGEVTFTMKYKNDFCSYSITISDPGFCSDCENAPARINEFHYDNEGIDENEFIEVYIPDPQPAVLERYSIELYNGSNGTKYAEKTLDSMTMTNDATGAYYVWGFAGMQNGSPDGIALIGECGDVLEFLSYEGDFTATDGKANGLNSVDVGVAELSSSPLNSSLQLVSDNWKYTVGYNTKGLINDEGPCIIVSPGMKDNLCNNNETTYDPTDDYITFKCKPLGNKLTGQYKLVSTSTKIIPEIADFGVETSFQTEEGTTGKGDIIVELISLDSANCTSGFILIDNGSCSPHCKIVSSNISEINCDQNSTSADTLDDFLWFYIEPSGFNLGEQYAVQVNKGTISPIIADFGTKTHFNLQPGSAGGGDIELTITDISSSSCILKNIITDLGPCSPDATSYEEMKRFVTIFPNPVHDQLFLSTENDEISSYIIVDIVGRKVLIGRFSNKIDVSELCGSVYFILFYDKNNLLFEIQKFIKE